MNVDECICLLYEAQPKGLDKIIEKLKKQYQKVPKHKKKSTHTQSTELVYKINNNMPHAGDCEQR